MSYFVVVYDRCKRKLLQLREFPEGERGAAEQFRRQALRHSIDENPDQEVVLFQAASEEALRRTHGSYFLSTEELLNPLREATRPARDGARTSHGRISLAHTDGRGAAPGAAVPGARRRSGVPPVQDGARMAIGVGVRQAIA
jgi:hypothetical protein